MRNLNLWIIHWNIKVKKETMHSEVLWICLLLQQCLDGTYPGAPLTPASDYPSTFLLVANLRISHSAVLNHRDKSTPFFELKSLLLINHESPDSLELLHQGRGHCHNCLVNMHLQASYTSLSLGFYFNLDNVAV